MCVRGAVFFSLALVGQAAHGLTLDADDTIAAREAGFNHLAAAQAQIFYSDTVSRVQNSERSACLVSTGTNWKATGAARHADGFEAILATGANVTDALATTTPVGIADLSSNTPYLMFATGGDLPTFVRFATGFAIDAETVRVEFGTGFDNVVDMPLDVEGRGDTGVFRSGPVVDALFAAYRSGEPIRITARSEKNVEETEHYLSYTFEGAFDQGAFDVCLNDLSDAKAALTASQTPIFEIEPVTDLDPSARMAVRGMACNREMDPNGAELVRLTGEIQGFATPIPYALVQRNLEGEVTDIWSGDLWRISKTKGGYKLAFSNSVTSQGPLDAQENKACTRFAEAACATLSFDDGVGTDGLPGAISVGSCFEELVAGSALTGGDPYVPSTTHTPFSVASFSTTGTPTAAPSPKSPPPSISITPPGAPRSIVETIGGGPKPGCVIDCGKAPGDPIEPDVSAVPVPPAGLLLGGAFLFGATLRRRKKAA